MQSWKKISSKVILDHPRIKVVEDMVELPNGKTTDYVRFESRGDSTTVICVNNEGKFLLQREYTYPSNSILVQFPGGFVSEGESVEAGANRELMEESKLQAGKLVLLGNYLSNNRKSKTMCYVFLAVDLIEGVRQEDDQEFIENFWASEEEIVTMIKNNEIKDGSMLAAWALYKNQGKVGCRVM